MPTKKQFLVGITVILVFAIVTFVFIVTPVSKNKKDRKEFSVSFYENKRNST